MSHRRLARIVLHALALSFGIVLVAAAADTPDDPTSDPSGWIDLLANAGPGLNGWTRGSIPPGKPLSAESQWSLDTNTGTLLCRGDGGHDWLRWDREFTDFVYHVDWRFVPIKGEPQPIAEPRRAPDRKLLSGLLALGYDEASKKTLFYPQGEGGLLTPGRLTVYNDALDWAEKNQGTLDDPAKLAALYKELAEKATNSGADMPQGCVIPQAALDGRRSEGMLILGYDKEKKAVTYTPQGMGDMVKGIDTRDYAAVSKFARETKPKRGYNSGVYVRNSADATIWIQAQTGDASGGFLFGDVPVDGKITRINLAKQLIEQRVKPAGEWNTYEITCKGKDIILKVNGDTTNEWHDCPVPKGYVGLEAEGWRIEFRNVKVKPL
jgi:hypothetical protein